MATFIYSPAVRVYIDTEKHGVIDVSDDLSSGTLVRRSDGVSTFDFTMTNARRKYDGVFAPNDRIVVLMKRVTWVRVFTGLLNSAPLKTAWPREVSLSASCSLKRLQYWYWDAHTAETQTMIQGALSKRGNDVDGSIITVITTILDKVVGWPKSHVHIGRIPEDWYKIASTIAERVDAWAEESDALAAEFMASLGQNATVAGVPVGGSATGLLAPGKYGPHTLTAEQVGNAEIIFNVGSQMGMSNRDIVIGLATAMQESSLVNLSGGDRDSAGLFQQRPSMGWGSLKQVTTPEYAARKFFEALKKVAKRDKMSEGQAAQTVQASAHPEAYDDDVPMGYAMVNTINAKIARGNAGRSNASHVPGSSGGGTVGQTTGTAFLAVALDLVERYPNIPYTQAYGGTRTDIIGQNPPPGLDCSSFVQAIYMRTVGKVEKCPRTSSAQSTWTRRISVEQGLNTPGALMFSPGHVEISLGNGNDTVGAHRPGRPASVARYRQSWTHAGLIPTLTYSGVGQGGGPTQISGSSSVQVGGTGQWPVAAKEITTSYKVKGSHWALGYHTGIDFGNADTGDEVSSITEGKVIGAGDFGAYGQCVRVMSGGLMILYAHLSQISVSNGQQVTPGQKLGEVGSTGNSTGPHLHLEVRKAPYDYGDDVDPGAMITRGLWSADSSAGPGLANTTTGGWEPPPPASELPGYDPDDPIDKLFGDAPWAPVMTQDSEDSTLANALQGSRALLNDQPLLPYIKNLFSSTIRSFCSAPNGDLIGWFPDYYGLWGTAGKLRVEPIELQDFNVMWSDDQFVTHQFTQAGVAATLSMANGVVGTNFSSILRSTTTLGIANIDSPEIMYSLFGVKPEDSNGFARWVYQRFGARPDFQQMEGLVGPKAEFFSALYLFMRQWAYQYNADVPMTFMPEAWPGMLLQVPVFDFQAYITTVTHSFTFGEGGRFDTTVNIAAPAYMPRKGKVDKSHALFGLPLAGQYAPGQGIGGGAPTVAIPSGSPTTGGNFKPGDQPVVV